MQSQVLAEGQQNCTKQFSVTRKQILRVTRDSRTALKLESQTKTGSKLSKRGVQKIYTDN